MNKLFFPTVAEQTIILHYLLNNLFFTKKNIALPQESNGRPLKVRLKTPPQSSIGQASQKSLGSPDHFGIFHFSNISIQAFPGKYYSEPVSKNHLQWHPDIGCSIHFVGILVKLDVKVKVYVKPN